jgi:hypothetical protein
MKARMVCTQPLDGVLSSPEGDEGTLDCSAKGIEEDSVAFPLELYLFFALERTLEPRVDLIERHLPPDEECGLTCIAKHVQQLPAQGKNVSCSVGRRVCHFVEAQELLKLFDSAVACRLAAPHVSDGAAAEGKGIPDEVVAHRRVRGQAIQG